jgi:mono/diheme cytochrome c family protein
MTRRTDYLLRAVVLALAAGLVGCKQQMADQPFYKPYEPTDFFEDGRSNRPLERGVVHRGQYLDSDPLVTGLTQEEWGRFWARGEKKVDPAAAPAAEDRQTSYGAARFDPRPGQPNSGPAVFVTEFPFEITARDLAVGGQRFTQYCAMCHGPLGDGKGKIWERGYLRPTSFHTEAGDPAEFGQIPYGFSRGFWKWDIRIPMRDVPVGYYFEVITKGYGGMASYAAQIKPADRWRIVAYIRALQLSQRAEVGQLPADVVGGLNAGGNQP